MMQIIALSLQRNVKPTVIIITSERNEKETESKDYQNLDDQEGILTSSEKVAK